MSTRFQEQPCQHGSRSTTLSRSRFILEGYSITAAALMGSTVGLVVYQIRQLFLLKRIAGVDLMPPPPPSEAPFWGHHPDPNSHPLSHSHDWQQSQHQNHHHHEHFHYRRTLSFFLSMWPSVLIWLACTFLCSILISNRSLVPKVISTRTGILASQLSVAFLWILLGGVQEVQEQLLTKQRDALRNVNHNPMTDDMDGQAEQVLSELGWDIRRMTVPLWTIWYTGLILLGCATGLLTMSSSLLRKQLEGAYQVAHGIEEEKNGGERKEKEHSGAVHLDFKNFDSIAQVTAKPLSSSASPVGYSIRERGMMAVLVLALFSSQIVLFHWILRAQSWAAYQSGMNTSVTLWLLFVGLMSGTVMISFGLRYLPRPFESLSYTDLD